MPSFLRLTIPLLVVLFSLDFCEAQSLRKNADLKQGYKLFKSGNYAAALPFYERLIKDFSQYPGLHFKIAYCYLQTGENLHKAMTHFREATKGTKAIAI